MYKTSSTYACWSHGDLGDPEGDYADRWVRSYRKPVSRPACTNPGCERPQTARGPVCMPCFMDALLQSKGQ
jgi:hypothetical protein